MRFLPPCATAEAGAYRDWRRRQTVIECMRCGAQVGTITDQLLVKAPSVSAARYMSESMMELHRYPPIRWRAP